MPNGMRRSFFYVLNDEEIEEIKKEILAIGADIDRFDFNSEKALGTSYDDVEDMIHVKGNVLPDYSGYSSHPRDLLSVRAVLAHEYYGRRPHREEYLNDRNTGTETTPRWKDEFRASIEASQNTPNLDERDKFLLVQDAVQRTREAGYNIEENEYIREVLYGDYSGEKGISTKLSEFRFHRSAGDNSAAKERKNYYKMSKV